MLLGLVAPQLLFELLDALIKLSLLAFPHLAATFEELPLAPHDARDFRLTGAALEIVGKDDVI